MIAFIHIDKTAGTTLYHILRRSFGAAHCDVKIWPKQTKAEREANFKIASAKDIKRTRSLVYHNLKSIGGHHITPFGDLSTDLEGIRFYTFVRDPLKRCASHFQFFRQERKENTESFEEWISRDHYRNVMCQKLCGEQNAQKAIKVLKERVGFIGMQEKFEESLVLLQHWVKPYALDIRYKAQNVAKHSKLKTELYENPVHKRLMEEANLEDQKVFNWVRETYWPEQLERFELDLDEALNHFREENAKFVLRRREPWSGQLTRDLLYKPLMRFISHGVYSKAEN